MKTYKIEELEGALLDYWVAKANGHQWRCEWMLEKNGMVEWQRYEHAWGNPTPRYATEWEHGGPIIEREGLVIGPELKGGSASGRWRGVLFRGDEFLEDKPGPTPLIAAMRAFVASKFGETVEL